MAMASRRLGGRVIEEAVIVKSLVEGLAVDALLDGLFSGQRGWLMVVMAVGGGGRRVGGRRRCGHRRGTVTVRGIREGVGH